MRSEIWHKIVLDSLINECVLICKSAILTNCYRYFNASEDLIKLTDILSCFLPQLWFASFLDSPYVTAACNSTSS